MAAEYKYIGYETTPLYSAERGNKNHLHLLWGDRVEVIKKGAKRSKVKARGWTGYTDNKALNGESLLELYFIDVGQGDSVLIRTPDDKHIFIDGGYPRSRLTTGKNGADFVDRKFFKDYGKKTIQLDAMIASHNDSDHFGGLWDLLNPNETYELDAQNVTVDKFYHAGNSGPWVRLYMEGNEEKDYPWCARFVSYLLKSAAKSCSKNSPIKYTYSCDVIANEAKEKDIFVEGKDAEQSPNEIIGDIFLVKGKREGDWIHTGIVQGANKDFVRTIEGNTNDEGSREGYEVCEKIRSYKRLDFVGLNS